MIYKWFGTVCFLSAAILLSANIEWSRYGFFIFLTGHVLLSYYFWFRQRDAALATQNTCFILIDAMGIYRWFIA